MKKLLFAIAFMTAGSVAVLAQESKESTSATPQTPPTEQAPPAEQTPPSEIQAAPSPEVDQDRQPIASSELPANIQAALTGQDYSGWTIGNAFKHEKDGKTFYSVELTKGDEKKTVKFDADGNVMKDEEKQN